ncbi:MAG TPA: UvrD-helicase domain-containing protein [Vicinamibacterales bacterium]|nr:UvrD-helicase domain-containing protein [Vicinamibacterales bacterium]
MSDRLPFDDDEPLGKGDFPDDEARHRAVDPAHHVVLEASAGTGKTHVLVDRYLNLLLHGVDPANILAITFTRKAAAEMRARIVKALRERAPRSPEERALWAEMRDRSADIAISTIDAFCLSLLHEFPLEADLDPGFDIADETQVPRLMEEALDRALDIGRGLAKTDEYVRLLFAELREPRIREGLAGMINRRLVVEGALERALQAGPRDLTAAKACAQAFVRLRDVFAGLTGGMEAFLGSGPVLERRYEMFAADMRRLAAGSVPDPGLARSLLDRIKSHFLVEGKRPRQRFTGYSAEDCRSKAAWKAHLEDIQRIAPGVADALTGFRRDLNAVLSRGVRRIYRIALEQYYATLDAHGVLDFPETLARAVILLSQMEEFARSRYRLEARYHHVLVDEFQDTSRAQWQLVALLIRSWGEGVGLSAHAPLEPTIFLVGDRKQSIYGFRDADVAVMKEAAAFVDRLRPEADTRRAISRSFRAVPQLLAFVNDVFADVERNRTRADAFEFDSQDRFPVGEMPPASAPVLGIAAAPTVAGCADIVAAEIKRLLAAGEIVRDPETTHARPMSPRDVAILFRARDSHQEFERALERRQIPSYVYKGLGFFEADEIKDVVSLLRYLASPESNLRAAAFLRSRFVRLSDPALQALAPDIASVLAGFRPPAAAEAFDEEDRLVLATARESMARWLSLVDRLPPAEILELALDETAYLFETRGPRARQARENLKKIRSMIRRVQNRGYATMSRIAEHLDRLADGDDSNAVIDAGDAVSLMTVHAAKGLEFPVVFVVNLSRGTGGRRPAIRVVSDGDAERAWISVGQFQSEADEDAKDRDREETKRLLYVALTRARDRLYLASEVKEGRWRTAAGSLGEVLPLTLRARFESAAVRPEASSTAWVAASGQSHLLRVCPMPGELPMVSEAGGSGPIQHRQTCDNFDLLADPLAVPRMAVTASIARRTPTLNHARIDTHSRSLTGTLVHRLFERHGAALASIDVITGELERLVRDDELVEADDIEQLLAEARASYVALCAQPALAGVLKAGEPLFEVPFSVRAAHAKAILRGTFDCLVRRRDGGVTILELKTGKPLPEHQEQLDIYLTAARALFPGTAVEGKLIYAGPADLPLMDSRSLDQNG